ncbi:proteasome subunit beta type-4 precursor, putative [Entamoeba invadens IP1]|uniref:proteasome subunit beta type-4 precursor, putative n=1 Tax=Entamoeba invadens IP1 TaxID=370355 RepID=UPI0002C3E03D|nr:proteasome subunit beta type-4 precursor, putative [Entamoeba invadens IP1]ELP93498.1 proteasome subunit beta type-4 precursor, putative [Entamoeba invadens IP1]|eukprot:XP_004260269.1 proteasome subunit beta type-4 precursor, putative [Entamoeba invadens IP1]
MQTVDMPMKHAEGVLLGTASIVGIKYNGGVILATDTLASYGSMVYSNQINRIDRLGKHTIIAASGELSDYQEIKNVMMKKVNGESTTDDAEEDEEDKKNSGKGLGPKELFSYLNRMMYQKRTDMKPLYNTVVVAGVKDKKVFLGQTDMYGTSFEENYVSTGIGAHMVIPLIRKEWNAEFTQEQALSLIKRCFQILYLNHCFAGKMYKTAIVTDNKVEMSEPITIDTTGRWDIFY